MNEIITNPLPKLSHLQGYVLSFLSGKEKVSSEEIRTHIAKVKPMSMPSFYQLMGRIEKATWVAGEYTRYQFGKNSVRVRHYKITTVGLSELERLSAFYRPYIICQRPELVPSLKQRRPGVGWGNSG